MHISAPHFHDEQAAYEYLEKLMWPNGPICPHCGTENGRVYDLKGEKCRIGLKKCGECRKQFTVTVNTVMHRSHIPIRKWLLAAYLVSGSKKGMSAKQLGRVLEISYKSAFYLLHRLREAMHEELGYIGKDGVVLVDETYWGNMRKHYKRGGKGHKMKIVAILEKGGNVKAFPVPDTTGKTLKTAIQRNVHPSAHIMTDEHTGYIGLDKMFSGHTTVRHSRYQWAKDDGTTTNQIESFFSVLKRGFRGIYHKVSPQHLSRYATEFAFRHNHRHETDVERADSIIRGGFGKRMTMKGYYRDFRKDKSLVPMLSARNPIHLEHCSKPGGLTESDFRRFGRWITENAETVAEMLQDSMNPQET